jgi:hypothetical protein
MRHRQLQVCDAGIEIIQEALGGARILRFVLRVAAR